MRDDLTPRRIGSVVIAVVVVRRGREFSRQHSDHILTPGLALSTCLTFAGCSHKMIFVVKDTSLTDALGVILMTKLLEKAFNEASKLSSQEQDALAAIIIDELIAERRWEQAFDKSPDLLEKLANEALEEYHAGKTLPLDPD